MCCSKIFVKISHIRIELHLQKCLNTILWFIECCICHLSFSLSGWLILQSVWVCFDRGRRKLLTLSTSAGDQGERSCEFHVQSFCQRLPGFLSHSITIESQICITINFGLNCQKQDKVTFLQLLWANDWCFYQIWIDFFVVIVQFPYRLWIFNFEHWKCSVPYTNWSPF